MTESRSCSRYRLPRPCRREIEEVEYDVDPKDLRLTFHHASGAGGLNVVPKVATAVRIVHLPTNIKVEMR